MLDFNLDRFTADLPLDLFSFIIKVGPSWPLYDAMCIKRYFYLRWWECQFLSTLWDLHELFCLLLCSSSIPDLPGRWVNTQPNTWEDPSSGLHSIPSSLLPSFLEFPLISTHLPINNLLYFWYFALKVTVTLVFTSNSLFFQLNWVMSGCPTPRHFLWHG